MSTQVGEYRYSLSQLEATLEATPEDRISGFRESNKEVWLFLVDPHYRDSRRAAEKKRLEAAKPKKAAPAARSAGQFLTDAHLPAISKWLAKAWGPKIGKEIRENVAGLADAGRLAELQSRVTELETRLAGYEKRAAAHDTAISAHRKHLNNLEIRTNDLKRAVAGEPPSGERIER